MAYNEASYKNNRALLSGKDACIFNEEGTLLTTIESWNAQVNFTNATYTPLGTALQGEFMTSYAVTIAIAQFVVESDKFIQDVFDFFQASRHAPHWTFSSVLNGYDGSEERMVFRDCIPSGQCDLHNITIGDIVKRNLNLHVNRPPELQKLLTFASE